MIRFADRHPIAFLAALAAVMAAVGWTLRDTTPPTPVEPARSVAPATAAPAVTVPPSSTAAATVAGGALGDGDVEVSSTTAATVVGGALGDGDVEVSSTTTVVAPLPEVIASPPMTSHPVECGEWRDLIATYFPGEVDTACRVFVGCESKGDPNAVSATGDHGLAQINAATWNRPGHHDPVADWIGRHWAYVYDPAVNLEMAAKIRAAYGWQSWSCF